ncbi:hypothetical protein PCI56_18055 [Plesiomonas shigelloides subsp. oncorhynchi]|nr:hypothetical protein [Plesiomonas shigelloides]
MAGTYQSEGRDVCINPCRTPFCAPDLVDQASVVLLCSLLFSVYRLQWGWSALACGVVVLIPMLCLLGSRFATAAHCTLSKSCVRLWWENSPKFL